MSKPIKRFYKQAGWAAVEDGFAVVLDGKTVKTPAGRPLVVPGQALAEEIAAEWQAQDQMVRPSTMPLTQLAATALDRVGPEREAILAQLIAYAGTDLVCYRADHPSDLVERQTRSWQPLLDWAAAELGAVMTVTRGVVAVEQPPEALASLMARLEEYDTWRLTAVQAACAAAGSLVLALALAEGRITAAETFQFSQVDETWQMEKWGEDYEAADRRAALLRDIAAAGRLLVLV